ncbi:MAG: glucosidase, partial [Myxococcales bacterium]|nr:glucosidase [Myxococcales bacterium]
MSADRPKTEEHGRLDEARAAAEGTGGAKWRRWGTYLSERQWGTVREDYSDSGDAWLSFPYDQSRSRVYRWGEDGILGLSDNRGTFNVAVTLWNGKDSHLKERFFGLSGPEGNHGEDVKELFYYLDATPTCSYARALYKYPHGPFPYEELRAMARARGRDGTTPHLLETGVFDGGTYFDVQVEYAKAAADDVLVRITVTNQGPEERSIVVMPTFWFRNTWAWTKESSSKTAAALEKR